MYSYLAFKEVIILWENHKIFSYTLVSETRKVEVFKDKRTSTKDKYTQQSKETGKYAEGLDRTKEKYPEYEKYFEGLKESRAFYETIERGVLKDLKRKGLLP